MVRLFTSTHISSTEESSMLLRITVCVTALLLCAAALGSAQTPVKYATIQIIPFEAAKGVDFPPDFQAAMIDSLIKRFEGNKKFTKILRPDEAAPTPAVPMLKLSGIVTEVDEGSRAARSLVGFGAGSSYIKAMVKFVDAASGETKIETELTGSYKGTWSMAGGKSANVCDGLAKQIVKLANGKF
jgi:hypothetical protein